MSSVTLALYLRSNLIGSCAEWSLCVATMGLVVVTGVLAWVTYLLRKETARSAKAAADNVEETRKMTWAANLPAMSVIARKSPDDVFETLGIRNIGKGPAYIDALYEDGEDEPLDKFNGFKLFPDPKGMGFPCHGLRHLMCRRDPNDIKLRLVYRNLTGEQEEFPFTLRFMPSIHIIPGRW